VNHEKACCPKNTRNRFDRFRRFADGNGGGVSDLLDTPLVPDSADPSYYTENIILRKRAPIMRSRKISPRN